MRLTTVILIASLLQVSAATFGQRITINQKNAPLESVLKEIRKQSGFGVYYDSKVVTAKQKIDIAVKDASLEDALTSALQGLELSFEIEDNVIVIKKAKEPSFLDRLASRFANIDVRGRVVDSTGNALAGATVKIKGTNRVVITNNDGVFSLTDVDEKAMLVISYTGYENKEIVVSENLGNIGLTSSTGILEEVAVVSTGYQTLPKERATGSFTTINEKTLNRSVGINILDRLDGVASGLILNRNLRGNNNSKISIHGRSTLFAGAEPLIVLDGFPYDGTIDQINPADITSINLLKDAAASSIWGARSGNGVIVITTKRGSKNQDLSIGLVSTLTVGQKPDLFYTPQMSSSEYIELEQFLFNKGFYNSRFNNPYNIVSPAVEIFNQRKNKIITSADSAQRINELKSYDVRNEQEKYFYRPKVYQQYQLNLNGGNGKHSYYMSGGYDKNLENLVSDSYDRLTLTANNTFNLFQDKLEISADVNFISSNTKTNNAYVPYTPYDRLKDENENSLAVVRDFRMSYVDTAGRGNLLDWHYRPLDELDPNSVLKLNQYRIKTGINYKILDGLNISANYQYLNENRNRALLEDQNRYNTRNSINRYSSISGNTVNRVIPLGSYFNQSKGDLVSKIFRAQLNFNRVFNDHEINAIGGYEGADRRSSLSGQDLYGYDPETMTHANATINPTNFYKYYYSFGSSNISTAPVLSGITEINQSYFVNTSYAYKKRYILSGSARRDESNLFGVKTNQKGVPLWSVGLAWNVDNEDFYNVNWLPKLKVRATYGYNGNLDRTTTAYLASIDLGLVNEWGSRYSQITSPSNPSLRWEKIKTLNLGIDFGSVNDRITGSIDLYEKNAEDLISNSPVAFQTGVGEFRGNTADLHTKGFDFVLNTRNLIDRFIWNTSLLLNFNRDKVTSYKVKQSSNLALVINNFANPLEGYPYHALFSFPSAGLDAIGKPLGYFNGELTNNLSKIMNTFDLNQVKYHGSASPSMFGSLMNTIEFERFELSFNVTYKFDYFFRRLNVFSGSNFGTSAASVYRLGDFDKRWKQPGDEFITNIPALLYPSTAAQNDFFLNSSELVERADNIRLRDVRLSYSIQPQLLEKIAIKKATFFVYGQNCGLLWTANKLGLDPDFGTTLIPLAFNLSLGINISL
ncbi:MAG: SusC/RagA family TonB-linked outer membrane protein [Bacteroidota bacterium]